MTTTGVDRIAGLSGSVAIKAPCQYRTTANITLSGLAVQAGGTWGSTLTQDDSNPTRILVHNQDNPVDNGVWNPGSGTWQRARDFNGSRDVVQGTLVHVYQDATDLFYELTAADPVIGTSSLTFAGVDSVALSTILARLTSTSVVSDGAAMIGRNSQVVDSIAALRLLLKTSPSVNAFVTGYYAAYDGGGGPYRYDSTDTTTADNGGTVIVAADGGRWKLIHNGVLSVKQFGAKGDGSTDDTAAVTAADTAACDGTLGLDGVTRLAQAKVYFPPGRYKVTGLTYRGAPWFGAGMGVTFLDLYASSGPCIDAQGATGARRLLRISDMSLNGSNATGTAYGLRIGYNQRSMKALENVRIDAFPGQAIHFDDLTWIMSFDNVYCRSNSNGIGSVGSAITIDTGLASGTLLAITWNNLVLEDNGYASSGLGGGIELASAACFNWTFFGGTWESNYGNAEARFVGVNGAHVDGLYLESFVARVANGLVFAGACFGSVRKSHLAGETTQTGAAVLVSGTANVRVEHNDSNIKWTWDLKVENTALVTLGGINAMLLFSVATGAVMQREWLNRKQLTDAATIATNAAEANSFHVTLAGNRTMGAPTNPSIGQQIVYTIIQDGTGGRTLAWNAVFKQVWSDTGNTANKRSTIRFEFDGTNWTQISAQTAYIT